MDTENHKKIGAFIQELEKAINEKNEEDANKFTEEFFNNSFPCELKLSHSNPIPIPEGRIYQHIIDLEQKKFDSLEKINEKIQKKLIKAGHPIDLCKEASKNTSNLPEALKKLKDLKDKKNARRF